MIKAGIIGATGYAGAELVRILMGHKEVEIVWYGSRSYIDQKYASVYHNMFEIVDATCLDDNMEALCEQVDVIFTICSDREDFVQDKDRGSECGFSYQRCCYL